MSQLPARVLFGAAYYHEYQPTDRLKTDLDLMVAAHFSVIRVGESVWSTWEPENGRFDLEWLLPVLDGAHERGIGVILGTPTYAVPPWLARLYPEIAGERSTAQRIPWGARQEVDFTHPGFRFHAERVIRQIVSRYAGHPAVIGFQVDNEPGNELLHNHGTFQRFVDHLRNTYGDVETLNREWGLVYWSHRLSTWADLWTPDGNVQPQYDVAWRRFQAMLTTEFIGWQAGIVREYSRPDQFVTTCISYERPAVEDDELTDSLDVTAGNPYYTMQDGLRLPDDEAPQQDWTTTGTWALLQTADRMYSSRQEPFLVTETNAMHIGFPWNNRPAYDGQWRQAAWALVSRGARMVEYWQWHTLLFGAETCWGGVLPHSGTPGRTYAEIARLGAEFERAGALVAGVTPDADVTIAYSMPSKWLMQKYPPLARADGGPDERAYHGLLDPFYRGAVDARRQVRISHVRQLAGLDPAAAAAEHPVLIVPGLYIADDAMLDWLDAYAAEGGHLVLGPRTAYADHEARARAERAPARLTGAAGVWYDEFSNLTEEVRITGRPAVPAAGPSAPAAGVSGAAVGGSASAAGVSGAAVGGSASAAGVSGAAVGGSASAAGVSGAAAGGSASAAGVSGAAAGGSASAAGVSGAAAGLSAPSAGVSAPASGMSHTQRRLDVPPAAAGTRWVEGLTVDGADILAEYDHPHFGRWPAITTTAYGRGRVTTVGTVPNGALAEALVAWLAPEPRHGWQDIPATVTIHTGSSTDGRRLHFVHNWSWERTSVVAPADLTDAISDDHIAGGEALTLGPWDVRVLVSRGADAPATPRAARRDQ